MAVEEDHFYLKQLNASFTQRNAMIILSNKSQGLKANLKPTWADNDHIKNVESTVLDSFPFFSSQLFPCTVSEVGNSPQKLMTIKTG